MNELIDLFFKGGFLMWPMLFQVILSLSIFLERIIFLFYTSINKTKLLELIELIQYQKLKIDEIWSHIEREFPKKTKTNETLILIKTILEKKQNSEPQIQIQGEELLQNLQKRISVLVLNAQTAPLIGLLGTVIGMIQSFQNISFEDGQIQPERIAEGIWVAMITTAFGLIIAITSYVFYFILDKIVEKRISMMNTALSLRFSFYEQV
ncbi:MAG: MotA/TolQ/ExbB proton channel family protein [Leptospiraceae bacterium]|nr:MotA/TolQ/ExbB proton channel family protein [Leptospiraceae bacterium]MDW7975990.1 MotA/TolQ/ExbB proton channel family protein [Leptospiraceae bacterium]